MRVWNWECDAVQEVTNLLGRECLLKKILKIILIAFLVVILSVIALIIIHHFTHGTTPAIRDAEGNPIPDSIASLEKIKLGGLDQYVLIRGRNKSNPILLSLHGGPGMPQMYLAHAFQRDLENYFTVVQWDRRGAGKSYSSSVPPETMNVEQMISDTYELVQHLRSRFGQPKIYLLAHSN